MADAGVGETAAAEGAKDVGEAAAVEGGADAAAGGAGAGAAAGGGLAAGDVAADAGVVGGTLGSGAGAGLSLDAGADAALGGAAGGAALDASATAGSATTASGFGGVGTDAAATGFGGAGTDASALGGAAAGGASTTASGFGGVGTDASATGFSAADAGGSSFLPVTGSTTTDGTMALSGDMANALGLGGDTGFEATELGGGGGSAGVDFGAGGAYGAGSDVTALAPDATLPGAADGGLDAAGGGGSWLDDATNWAGKHPLGLAQGGLMGLSALNALRTPKLPTQANQAGGAASAEVTQAQSILASGGTSSPQWATMKASIDAQVGQELQTAIAQMEQAAATNGMGGAASGVVQQQRATLEQRAIAQKEQLYSQALNQIVSQATSELSGGNQILTSIAGMQMQEDEQARQLANQIAQYGIELGLPGKTFGNTSSGP